MNCCLCRGATLLAGETKANRELFWLEGLLRLSPGLVPASTPLKRAVLGGRGGVNADECLHR